MKNKKWLLLLIIALPSLLWIILESSTINSYKLPYFGPKELDDNGDTIFYRVPSIFFTTQESDTSGANNFFIDEEKYPFYAIMFIKEKYDNESYRLPGLWEYLNYKKEKVGHIPFFLITESENNVSVVQNNLQKLTDNRNVHFLAVPKTKFDSLNRAYFNGKPFYIDYSFFALIDQNRNIRGYYDGRLAAEIKRLTGEYQHLRLQEEKRKLIDENEIKTKN